MTVLQFLQLAPYKVTVISYSSQLWAGCPRIWMLAGEREFSLLQNAQMHSWTHSASHSMCARVISCRNGGHGVKLSTHLHLVPWLRMNETTPLLSPYTFLAWTATKVPLLVIWSFFCYGALKHGWDDLASRDMFLIAVLLRSQLFGFNVLLLDRWFLTFWRNTISSTSRIRQSMEDCQWYSITHLRRSELLIFNFTVVLYSVWQFLLHNWLPCTVLIEKVTGA